MFHDVSGMNIGKREPTAVELYHEYILRTSDDYVC